MNKMFLIIISIFFSLAFLAFRISYSEKRFEKKLSILHNSLQQFSNKLAEDEEARKQRLLAKVRKYGIAPDDLQNIQLR